MMGSLCGNERLFRQDGSSERPHGPDHAAQEPVPYFQVARFRRERTAQRTYTGIQDVLFHSECDLSTYRFLLDQIAHVAVLGTRPAETLVRVIERTLAAGERTKVPEEIQALLERRRTQARAIGPWVEGHYRPGIRLQEEK